MKNFAATAISKALNRYLQLDPQSKQRLHSLQGKTVTIELLPFGYIVQCVFTERGAQVQESEILVADVKISGTPLQLLNIMFLKEDRQQFFAEDLTMTGDAEIGQQVIALFDELDIDWEERLSHVVGDASAFHLGRFARNVKKWVNNAGTALTSDVDEYLHEELNLLPTRETLNDFYNEIDSLRMDIDRAEAKIAALNKIANEDET